ncbi:MAG: efflux RND transporter periplasmic adaptor subunit [Patescibacteria group bacterium]
MFKLKKLLGNKYYWLGVGLVVVFVVWKLLSGNGDDKIEFIEVEPKTIVQIVSESGEVKPVEEVLVATQVSEKIIDLLAKEGMEVKRGDILALLNNSSLQSQKRQALAKLEAEQAKLTELLAGADEVLRSVSEAELTSAQLTVSEAEENLDLIKQEQNLAVNNARRDLLSTDIQAYLTDGGQEDSYFSYTPPTVSGTYNHTETGQYVISLYPSGQSSGYSARYEGLEKGITGVSTAEPKPLGNRGLYIQFPDDFATGSSLEWTIFVPNHRSQYYATKLNAYQSALESKDIAIERAEQDLAKAKATLGQVEASYERSISPARAEQIAIQEAAVKQAQVAVEALDLDITKTVITAPLAGQVIAVNKEVGEIATAGEVLFRIITEKEFELVVYIPEVDIAEVEVGDKAKVSFDAFRGQEFEAEVTFVAIQAERQSGVVQFKTKLLLKQAPAKLLAGLTADIDIETARRESVLAVPSRALDRSNGRTMVRVWEDNDWVEKEVKTGLRGYDGWVEVVEGLVAGDRVLTFRGN